MSYDTTWEMLICSFLKKHGSSGHKEFPSYLQRFFSDSTLIWDYCAGGGSWAPMCSVIRCLQHFFDICIKAPRKDICQYHQYVDDTLLYTSTPAPEMKIVVDILTPSLTLLRGCTSSSGISLLIWDSLGLRAPVKEAGRGCA